MATILHIAFVEHWEAAQEAGSYRWSTRGKSLDDGATFIHASRPEQVAKVANFVYADVAEPLCLLVIDPRKLRVPVVAENLEGGPEKFPHDYGPIPADAVTSVIELQHDRDGWRWPGRA